MVRVFGEWEKQREHPYDMLVHLGDGCLATVYCNVQIKYGNIII